MNELLEKFKKDNGFIKHNNYELENIEKDIVILKAIIKDEALNPYKICHGGFLFGLADTAAGISAVISNQKNAYTIDSNINYFKPCTGKYVKAISKIIKKGSNIVNIEVELINDNDKLVAKAIFNYFYV